MKTFETVRDVVTHGGDVHRQAANLYLRIAANSHDERNRMLLNHLSEHALRLRGLYKRFVDQATGSVIETYLQYTTENPPPEVLAEVDPSAHFSVEDIATLNQALHDYQVSLLEGAIRETSSKEVHEFLNDLLQIASAERRNAAKAVEEANTM